MEYAVVYWLRHLEAGMKFSGSGFQILQEEITESLELLIEQHWNSPVSSTNNVPNRIREMLKPMSESSAYPRILTAVVSTDKELRNFGDIRPDQSALDFGDVVLSVRRCLEAMAHGNRSQTTLADLELKYGTHLFKCPRISCRSFTEGFALLSEREMHNERHERPARCTDEHCRGSKIGFATNAQLEKHLRENHPDLAERHYDFPTEEEINESLRDDIPVVESEPEVESEVEQEEPEPEPQFDVGLPEDLLVPEVEQAPIQTMEPLVPQPTQPRTTTKRRKTKQDYECSHCGKKFNKKFNWQSHLRSHGGDQKFTCSHCGKACARSGDLVRHMKLHDPQNAVTCGGILSNGQRWGCGTSFARADILRSHHQSKRGRRCVAQRDGEVQAGPSI